MTNYATANGGTATSATGSLLQWLTIGYVGLVVVLLYPITVLVRKCRKRRKRKSASKRAQAHDANKDKSVALVDHKSQPLARTPSGDTDAESESSSSDDDDDNLPPPPPPPPPPRRRFAHAQITGATVPNLQNQNYVSPTLPKQDDNADDVGSESESSSSDDDDDAQASKFMFKCESCDNHYSTYEEAKHHEDNECENNPNYLCMSQNGETDVDMAGLPVSFALEVHG